MSELTERAAQLSPAQRDALFKRLAKQPEGSSPGRIEKQEENAGTYPVPPAQQRLWLLNQLIPESDIYNVPVALELEGSLDVEALRGSLNEMVRRHEALRTTFVAQDGEPRQVIAPTLTFALPLLNLETIAESERQAHLDLLLRQEVEAPFDLKCGPLIRACLLRLSTRKYVLLMVLHHIIADGWSLGVLFQELEALYTALCQGQTSPLPALPIQYRDYAAWLHLPEQLARQQAHLAYWREHLAGAPDVLALPTDHPRPAQQHYRGATLPFEVSARVSQGLRALSQREGCTLYQTLLAAFEVLLARHSGMEDFLLGTPIAGRQQREVEGLIGLFVNTLVMRADCAGQPPFGEMLRRVRRTTLEAYAHQEAPFERVVEAVCVQRDASYAPLVQVLFVLQNAPMELPRLPGVQVGWSELGNETAKFDLTLELTEQGQGLVGRLEYASDLFEQESMWRLIGQYQRVLEGIVADAQRSIAHLPLLTEEEERQLLVQWNETGSRY
ncbi:MAG TPA: condensation domain-containing protein, partial [Ktedonobacteraceae bacterium]|nr:condensation domain-containing protein [Ktedonobacteraceae bacterium]